MKTKKNLFRIRRTTNGNCDYSKVCFSMRVEHRISHFRAIHIRKSTHNVTQM